MEIINTHWDQAIESTIQFCFLYRFILQTRISLEIEKASKKQFRLQMNYGVHIYFRVCCNVGVRVKDTFNMGVIFN